MDQEMAKSLVNLIDETISEIEDLKKSRYSAAETRIGDSDSGVSNMDKDGNMEKEEAEKAEGKNSESDPGVPGTVDDAGADAPKSNLEQEARKMEQPAEGYHIKKSLDKQESLFKSYVDEKYDALEKRLAAILDVVKEIGDEPAAPKGVQTGGFVALQKNNEDEVETLSKSQTLDKLLDLKKSGTYVDTADIASVEIGGDPQAIVEKYNLN